jgi:hypothetical protein
MTPAAETLATATSREKPVVVRLDGPPENLDALLEQVAEQFGSNRRLVSGHKDRGLADQFQRMQKLWSSGDRDAIWFAARSAAGETRGLAVLTKRGTAWSNRAFGGGPPLSEFAYAFTDKPHAMGLREFTLRILESLSHEFYPLRVYGYALSQAVGYWARCAPGMGAVAAHNVLGVPSWIWLDRSFIGVDLSEPAACAAAVRKFPDRYVSGPPLDPAVMTSIGTVRAHDSPFAPEVRDENGSLHPLSVTYELADLHEKRVAAAFGELPDSIRARLSAHFAKVGLSAHGRRAVLRFWFRFIPAILLEDRTWLWPMLDFFTGVRRLTG